MFKISAILASNKNNAFLIYMKLTPHSYNSAGCIATAVVVKSVASSSVLVEAATYISAIFETTANTYAAVAEVGVINKYLTT